MVVLQRLQLELELISFRLKNASLVALTLDLFRILDKHLIAFNFELITVFAQQNSLLLRFTQTSLGLLGISAKLPGRIAVF